MEHRPPTTTTTSVVCRITITDSPSSRPGLAAILYSALSPSGAIFARDSTGNNDLVFNAIWLSFMAYLWTLAVLLFLTGRNIDRRRHHTFCLVVACVECLFLPLGTVLGIFTIAVLLRPSVKGLFGVPGPDCAAEHVEGGGRCSCFTGWGIMEAMKRWLFNIFAVFSLLLCVVTVVLWAASYFDHHLYVGGDVGAFVDGGHCGLIRDIPHVPHAASYGWWLTYPKIDRRFLGFGYYYGVGTYGLSGPIGPDCVACYYAPCWFLFLLVVPLGAWGARRLFRENEQARRKRLALCMTCGYDLRVQLAGQAGAKCPECRAPVPTPATREAKA